MVSLSFPIFPTLTQRVKRHPPKGFPEWYSNDPVLYWKSGSWEDYTNAAGQLDVVESDEGFYYLQKRENSVVTPCLEDLARSWFRFDKWCNSDRGITYSNITKTDCKNFHLLLDEADMDLQLFQDYFTPDGERAILQHDSTVESVVDRLPLRFINNTAAPMFPSLVKRLISMAKDQHELELYRDYSLFLPKCDRIKSDTTVEECLNMLKDDPHFVANKFGDLPSYYLFRGMKFYLNHKWSQSQGNRALYNDSIEKYYLREQDHLWQARSRHPGELMTPIHFLAFQKRHRGYQLQHPVQEIMKFRVYFGKFFEGVPPPWHPNQQNPEPSQVGSSPSSLERPKKRGRRPKEAGSFTMC